MGSAVGLPPGYKLDEPVDTGLPPGYTLDKPAVKEPTTSEDFIKLADSLPKGSKEREDAINMAVRLREPGAAGNAVALTAAIPAVANPLGLARSLGASIAGSWVGKHVGGWLGHPEAGRVIGGLAGALDPTTVPASARMIPFGVGHKLAPVFEKLFGAEPGLITGLAQKLFGKTTGELSQGEMVQIVKSLARGGEGDVANPSAEKVAAEMIPAQRIPQNELPPMTQGEMTTVTRGVGKPPAGWVENPSPEMVAKYMQRPVPEGVDPDAVAALQKWGMSFEDAVKTASRGMVAPAAASTGPKVLPMPARSVTASAPSTESIVLRLQQLSGGKITPEMEAYLAAQPEAEAAAMRAALGRASSKMPPVVGGLTVRPGPPATAPGDLEATLQASIDALKKRRAAQLALESQGKGVTVP